MKSMDIEKSSLGQQMAAIRNHANSEPPQLFASSEVAEIKLKLHNEILLSKAAEAEVNVKKRLIHWKNTEAARNAELLKLRKKLEDDEHEKAKLVDEIKMLQTQLLQISFEADQSRRNLDKDVSGEVPTSLDSLIPQVKHQQQLEESGGRESIDGETL